MNLSLVSILSEKTHQWQPFNIQYILLSKANCRSPFPLPPKRVQKCQVPHGLGIRTFLEFHCVIPLLADSCNKFSIFNTYFCEGSMVTLPSLTIKTNKEEFEPVCMEPLSLLPSLEDICNTFSIFNTYVCEGPMVTLAYLTIKTNKKCSISTVLSLQANLQYSICVFVLRRWLLSFSIHSTRIDSFNILLV